MQYVYVSSWPHGNEPGGLAQYIFHPETGEMDYVRTVNQEKACGSTLLDRERGILYVLNEKADLEGRRAGGGGEVLTYRLNRETGEATLIQAVPTLSPNPAKIAVDPDRSYMVVVNHGTKTYVTKICREANGGFRSEAVFDDSAVDLFRLNCDGTVGELLDVDLHTGDGPQKPQLSPHPHSAVFTPSGSAFLVCDKGNDTLTWYTIDRKADKLVKLGDPVLAPAGSMPRYGVFHPTLPFFYHNNEGYLDVHAYQYGEAGSMEWIGAFSARENPEDKGEQQDLVMDGSGTYLYDVLKGPNQVAVFKINQENGSLQLIQSLSLGYAWPRSAILSPDGKYLLIACMKEEKIVVLRIQEDGTLVRTGQEQEQPLAAYGSIWDTD